MQCCNVVGKSKPSPQAFKPDTRICVVIANRVYRGEVTVIDSDGELPVDEARKIRVSK